MNDHTCIGYDDLIDLALLDLSRGNVAEAGRRIEEAVANVRGDAQCDALVARIFWFLCSDRPAAARNIARYLTYTWTGERTDQAWRRARDVLAYSPYLNRTLESLLGVVVPWTRAWSDFFPSQLDRLATQTRHNARASDPSGLVSKDGECRIVIGLTGGIGSQMFQYAAALNWARRCAGRISIDRRFYTDVVREDRRYWLDLFNIDAATATTDDIEHVAMYRHEQDLTVLDERMLHGTGSVYLAGFWPSDIYFSPVSDELRKHFKFKNGSITRYAEDFVGNIRAMGDPVVAVHVRRGDNTLAYNRNSYRLHPADYYRDAAARFPKNCTFLVFSDTNLDLEWCKTNLSLGTGLRVVYSEAHSFIFDLALMAACDHHIISVSAFSWWAAWLGARKGQRVIVPPAEQGTGPTGAHFRQDERFPESWEVLTMLPGT